jgi:hypothetical protein
MHAALAPSANPVSRRHNRLQELNEELVVARSNLVAAVSDRSPDGLLVPLRAKVVELLETIERLYSVERLRHLD